MLIELYNYIRKIILPPSKFDFETKYNSVFNFMNIIYSKLCDIEKIITLNQKDILAPEHSQNLLDECARKKMNWSNGAKPLTEHLYTNTDTKIPKILHIIWIGDDALKPIKCIQSWIDHNPTYLVKVWNNDDLASIGWYNKKHIQIMLNKDLAGVADLMRYEILYNYGGITIDADSICLKPLEDWLLMPEGFCCWENEKIMPGLLSNGYMGSTPENKFFGNLILDLSRDSYDTLDSAWKLTGPLRLTRFWKNCYQPLTIYPSHYFIPNHYTGYAYNGKDFVFADQLWGSTKNIYKNNSTMR
jgi:mannosyltransferase OCH1-like enzyme